MTGPCGQDGCDCGHMIETLRRQKAELREVIQEILDHVENPGIERVGNQCTLCYTYRCKARAALANTKETP